jgi:predicted nucleic acid-binding protein
VIFIDSNVPMYLVGGAHPNKDATVRWLDRVIRTGERSLLTYLLHPLTKRMAASMKEE